jgi:hypothetical protein
MRKGRGDLPIGLVTDEMTKKALPSESDPRLPVMWDLPKIHVHDLRASVGRRPIPNPSMHGM